MTILGKFSIGVGDRFAHQAKAQLEACILAERAGEEVIPVWNKSNREHSIIGSEPSATRAAADAAVQSLGWINPYFCDADHITLTTVDGFLAPCDFFTIDVADYIGKAADPDSIDAFVGRHSELVGVIELKGVERGIEITRELLRGTAAKFLFAIEEAGKIYRKIEAAKGKGTSFPKSRWTRPTPRKHPPNCSSSSAQSPMSKSPSRRLPRNSVAASIRASTTSATSRNSPAKWPSIWLPSATLSMEYPGTSSSACTPAAISSPFIPPSTPRRRASLPACISKPLAPRGSKKSLGSPKPEASRWQRNLRRSL